MSLPELKIFHDSTPVKALKLAFSSPSSGLSLPRQEIYSGTIRVSVLFVQLTFSASALLSHGCSCCCCRGNDTNSDPSIEGFTQLITKSGLDWANYESSPCGAGCGHPPAGDATPGRQQRTHFAGRSLITLFTRFGTSARIISSCFNFLWDRL